MQEKSFKFRESFGVAINAMDDKTAGRFIKNICKYVFDNKHPESNDATLKSAFTLIKNTLDEEKEYKAYGKMGGQKSAEMRKKQNESIDIHVEKIGGENPYEMLKSMVENTTKSPKSDH